jgi:hypothetical protein
VYWLRRCATSRTVPGSISGGVTGFFSDKFPSDRTMALGSTQPLVKISTRNISGGKGGQCVRLTTSPPSRGECLNLLETSGSHRACNGTPLTLHVCQCTDTESGCAYTMERILCDKNFFFGTSLQDMYMTFFRFSSRTYLIPHA